MELKDFIESSIQSIIEATRNLAAKNDDTWINPSKTSYKNLDAVTRDGQFVPITDVEFDVAVTEGSSDSAGGKLNIQVLKAGGEVASNYSNVSRIKFSIRVALPSEKSESQSSSGI